MLVLFETPAGYALFKIADEKKVASVDDIVKHFGDASSAKKIVKLKAFKQFTDTDEATKAASAIIEGSDLDKSLKSFLKKEIKEESDKLAVLDAKLGGLIKQKLNIQCVFDSTVSELFRGIRQHLSELVEGLDANSMRSMSVGLAYSLARHKLQFTPDKVDTMIIQAIGLLDDIDKELNTYAMRTREWYGWHFPEMGKIVADNLMFARVVKKMGLRSNASETDFEDVVPNEIEAELKQAAIISMGTEISDVDLANIRLLADQVIALSEYRTQLYDYLKNRMGAVAPNLTVMVGELVGARLISHAGSLMNLAKHPASTVQILGAEKALFRALKTKKETPKYGLIYHASMVGQSAAKNKGKISRVLAAKTALSVRVDALGESSGPTIAIQDRAKVEQRLRQLEGGASLKLSGTGKARAKAEKFTPPTVSSYNANADTVMDTSDDKKGKKDKKRKHEEANGDAADVPAESTDKKDKKKDKKDKKDKEDTDEKPSKEEKKDKKDKKEKKDKKKADDDDDDDEAPAPKKSKTANGEKPKKDKKKKHDSD